jgi:LPXTG-motif cell wall-anchored protein
MQRGFLFYFSFGDPCTNFMTANQTVQLVAGILAVVLVAIIFLRRKNKKKDEDDF